MSPRAVSWLFGTVYGALIASWFFGLYSIAYVNDFWGFLPW